MLSLTLADTMSAVCREELAGTPVSAPGTAPAPDTPADTVPLDGAAINNQADDSETKQLGEWFAIDRLLRHRRQRGKDLYLVQWIYSDIPSCVERSIITDAALQHFYANRKRRKRRCN